MGKLNFDYLRMFEQSTTLMDRLRPKLHAYLRRDLEGDADHMVDNLWYNGVLITMKSWLEQEAWMKGIRSANAAAGMLAGKELRSSAGEILDKYMEELETERIKDENMELRKAALRKDIEERVAQAKLEQEKAAARERAPGEVSLVEETPQSNSELEDKVTISPE